MLPNMFLFWLHSFLYAPRDSQCHNAIVVITCQKRYAIRNLCSANKNITEPQELQGGKKMIILLGERTNTEGDHIDIELIVHLSLKS